MFIQHTGPLSLEITEGNVTLQVTANSAAALDGIVGQAARDGAVVAHCGGTNPDVAAFIAHHSAGHAGAADDSANVLPEQAVDWQALAAPALRQPGPIVINNGSGFPSYEYDWKAQAAPHLRDRPEPVYPDRPSGAVVPGVVYGQVPDWMRGVVANSGGDENNLLPEPPPLDFGPPPWAGGR